MLRLRALHTVAAILAGTTLCACSVTEPVVVITQTGQTLRGTATATISSGAFSATDGKLTCGGSYDSLAMAETITMPVLCSDGRKGIVISTRDTSKSGHGTVRLNDGTEAQFIFGPSAYNFYQRAVAVSARAQRQPPARHGRPPTTPGRLDGPIGGRSQLRAARYGLANLRQV